MFMYIHHGIYKLAIIIIYIDYIKQTVYATERLADESISRSIGRDECLTAFDEESITRSISSYCVCSCMLSAWCHNIITKLIYLLA